MSRDFAKKTSANKRGGASPRQEDAPVTQRRELPPWSWLIFGVVLGFGLAKWQGSGSEPPALPRMAAVPAEPAAVVPPDDSVAPQDEERKRFDFYNLLPQQEVTTAPVEEYQSTPRDTENENLPEYILQVGSFRAKADAERLVAKLKTQGHAPMIASTETASGTWHRVRIGPFKDRRKLNMAQDAMARDNIQSLLIRLPQ
ncbi:SPOR domain-containing protein [Oceanospirillum maris]|uniref:SPOR domain-containing protein n=1 Tax=Oceanospirillum maris TaxID=64977 RepID=UPI0003F4B880|nr:SPOR domain-containing protein [Oceanospirillum maris]